MAIWRGVAIIGAIWVAAGGGGSAGARVDVRLLSCEPPFDSQTSAAKLSKYFGAANVTDTDIEVGEGETERGTALFPTSRLDRVDILWTDKETQRNPRAILIRDPNNINQPKSRWRTRTGLTLGVSLHAIERMNRRPFRLLGFAWDYEGTVMSWAGGLLDSDRSATCSVRVRLTPGNVSDDSVRARWFRQVIGDRDFSSGHPAMQALDPFVYELWLEYPIS